MDFPRHIVFVSAIVFDGRGRLLLVKNPRRGWEPVGGQVELGEDLISALVREAKEESGYEIEVTELVSVLQNTGAPGSEPKVGFSFLARVTGGEARVSEEHEDIGWFPPARARELVREQSLADRLADALEHDGKIRIKTYITRPVFKITGGFENKQ